MQVRTARSTSLTVNRHPFPILSGRIGIVSKFFHLIKCNELVGRRHNTQKWSFGEFSRKVRRQKMGGPFSGYYGGFRADYLCDTKTEMELGNAMGNQKSGNATITVVRNSAHYARNQKECALWRIRNSAHYASICSTSTFADQFLGTSFQPILKTFKRTKSWHVVPNVVQNVPTRVRSNSWDCFSVPNVPNVPNAPNVPNVPNV